MKKMIATAVIAAMLVLLLSSAVLAAGDTLVISGNSATVKTGEVAIITLTVDQNPGFMGMIFYPVIKDANGNRLNWAWAAELTNPDMEFDLDQGKTMILTADDDCAAVGELMDVSFYVPSGAAPGVYTVAFLVSEGECLNAEFEEVSTSLPTVTITVTSTATTGCRHQNTTSVPGKDPTCIDDGYTTGIYCNDCLTFVSGHSKLETSGHNYEVTEDAVRCDEEGHKTYTCTGCGDSYAIPVEAQGHSFTNYVSNNDATCTEDGTEKAKCDRCEATFKRTAEGSALGHTAVVVSGYPATCTTDGLTDGKCCSVCGEILAPQAQIPAGEHLYGDWATTQRPTCTQTGLQTRSCVTCGDTQQETLDMLPHSVAVLNAVAATCNTPGLTEGVYCPGCQLVLTEQQQIEATGHSFGDWTVKTQATTKSEGEEIRTCANCTEQESRAIAKVIEETKFDVKLIVLIAVASAVLGAAAVLVIVALKKKNS